MIRSPRIHRNVGWDGRMGGIERERQRERQREEIERERERERHVETADLFVPVFAV